MFCLRATQNQKFLLTHICFVPELHKIRNCSKKCQNHSFATDSCHWVSFEHYRTWLLHHHLLLFVICQQEKCLFCPQTIGHQRSQQIKFNKFDRSSCRMDHGGLVHHFGWSFLNNLQIWVDQRTVSNHKAVWVCTYSAGWNSNHPSIKKVHGQWVGNKYCMK